MKTSRDVCKTDNIMLGKTSQNKILVLGKIIRFVSMWDRSNIHKYEPTPIERWIYYFVKNIKINLSFFHGINIKKKKCIIRLLLLKYISFKQWILFKQLLHVTYFNVFFLIFCITYFQDEEYEKIKKAQDKKTIRLK